MKFITFLQIELVLFFLPYTFRTNASNYLYKMTKILFINKEKENLVILFNGTLVFSGLFVIQCTTYETILNYFTSTR